MGHFQSDSCVLLTGHNYLKKLPLFLVHKVSCTLIVPSLLQAWNQPLLQGVLVPSMRGGYQRNSKLHIMIGVTLLLGHFNVEPE